MLVVYGLLTACDDESNEKGNDRLHGSNTRITSITDPSSFLLDRTLNQQDIVLFGPVLIVRNKILYAPQDQP